MTWLSRLFGLMPVAVDVAGRKSRLVLKLGDALLSKKNMERAELDGVLMGVDRSSLLRLWLYAEKNVGRTYSDSRLGEYMKSRLRSGDVFVDAGANIGGYSRLARSLGCEVHAFEAQPRLSSDLKSCEPVFGKIYPMALSDAQGEIEFHISEINPGGSSMVSSKKGWDHSGYDHTVKVPASTYDEVMLEGANPVGKVSLVKVDVEGAEAMVVRGMKNALSQDLIEAIWCEVRGPDSDRNPNSYLEVIDLLTPFGFRPFTNQPTADGGMSWIPYLPNEHGTPQYFDLLFLSNESSYSTDSDPSRVG